ncbi:MAG: SPOR domain-containing protein, partial [Caloramator sp.]|nr:SPOR domain-containing protein [Caloramator sp.]
MRYTRLELKKNSLSQFELGILYFFLVIPVVSIIIGWGLTNFILIPKLNIKNDNIKLITSNKINKIYVLQIGVFANETNAKSMVDNLNKIGVYGYYFKDNDIFRVITDVSVDNNIIQNKKVELDKKGISSLVKEIDITYKNKKKEDLVIEDVKNIIVAQIKVKDGQVTQEQFKEMLKELYNKYKDDKE